MGIGRRIGELTKSAGMNLHQLAQKSGISYNTLYAMVRRDSDGVSFSTIKRIASALDMPAHVVMGIEYEITEDSILNQFEDKKIIPREDGSVLVVTDETKKLCIDSKELLEHLNEAGMQKAYYYIYDLLDQPKYQLKSKKNNE